MGTGKGKLQLKGGVPWASTKPLKKVKKAKKTKAESEGAGADATKIVTREGATVDFTSIDVQSNRRYEDAFDLQMERAKEAKTRSTPWGSSYRAPPEILHGYTEKVDGNTAAERLDLRCAMKADKFCK